MAIWTLEFEVLGLELNECSLYLSLSVTFSRETEQGREIEGEREREGEEKDRQVRGGERSEREREKGERKRGRKSARAATKKQRYCSTQRLNDRERVKERGAGGAAHRDREGRCRGHGTVVEPAGQIQSGQTDQSHSGKYKTGPRTFFATRILVLEIS